MFFGGADMDEKICLQVLRKKKRRPACIFMQSDQCLCYSLIEKYIKTYNKENIAILASLCS